MDEPGVSGEVPSEFHPGKSGGFGRAPDPPGGGSAARSRKVRRRRWTTTTGAALFLRKSRGSLHSSWRRW